MRKVIAQNGQTKFFDPSRYDVGDLFEAMYGDVYIITAAEQGEAAGPDGVDQGWLHEMRLATDEERAEGGLSRNHYYGMIL